MLRLVLTTTAVLLASAALASLVSGLAAGPDHGRSGGAERAYVLMIHGGGWYRTGPHVVGLMAANRPRLRAWGYATDLVRYRPRRRAFPDVLAAYDRLRRRVGAAAPICAYGSSAGAQMALMLAIRRPDVACVISEAAPTELQRLGPYLRGRARDAFGGQEQLGRWSPALYELRTPTLLEQATSDRVVPFSQMTAMHRAAPNSRALTLSAGTAPWIHARVDPRELSRYRVVERRFMGAAIDRWRRFGPFPPATYMGPGHERRGGDGVASRP